MLEQVSTSVKFLAFFTASKTGKTGLTVTIDIYNPSGSQIVTAGSATALGGGLYSYTLSTDNSSEGEYAAIFKTTDSTVDAQHIPSLWVLGRAGVENLDAATSTRLPSSSYTAPANSDISAIKAKTDSLPSDPADQSLLEAAIAGVTAPSAATVASAVRTELSVELGRVDQAISSRLASASYTAPTSAPTAAAVASAVRAELTEISNLDASVSSRLASASYTAPANSDISAIKAKTDNLPASPAAVSDIPTTTQIATAVEGSLLDENDGQAVLNALVGAIGNQNLSEVSLVAAVRADLERAGGKIDSIPTTAAPSASTVAGAVRTELGTELGRIDAAVSSRLASASYTAPTAAPTAAANASAVRSELATELARVDAAVSTRLAGSAYTAPANSDVAAIKTKTDAINVDRINNTATTAIVGNLIAQANS